MLQRLASWWALQRREGALHGIISGFVIAAIGIIVLAPWDRTPRAKKLSKRAQDYLCKRAAELAPGAIEFARDLAVKTREIDETTDAEAIERYSAWVVAWSERFTSELEAEVAAMSAKEGVCADEVRRFLAEKLRELTGECVPELSVAPGAFRGIVFASPRLKFAPETVEQAMEAAIQRLLALLPKLPSQGQEGVKKAILALRKAIAPFDTKPITIVFTAPAPDAVVNFIPAIAFEMTDTGSGPNPASRKLVAVNTGPIVQQTTDLTTFTQLTLDDPVAGKAIVAATGIPSIALQDGFITLKASGTDFADNLLTIASGNLVLDRLPPAISFESPVNGSTFSSTTVALGVFVHDGVSGVKISTLSVTLNGVDITGQITISPGANNTLGAPNDLTLTGVLLASNGTNVLKVTTSDLAGNVGTGVSIFTIAIPSNIVLLKISGDNQEGVAGRCTDESLVVQAVDANDGNAPVSFLPISIRVVGGGGRPVKNRSFLTDESGKASSKFTFGVWVGTSTIEVSVFRRPEIAPVQFTLTTKKVALADVSQSGPCNFMPTTAEVSGSAIPKLIRLRLVDHQNNPMKGEDIVPTIKDFNGVEPVQFQVGRFLPERGVTDSNGEVVFAFVINKGVPSGTFTMRFRALSFLDEESKPIKVDIGGGVNPGGSNFAEINYQDDPPAPGQSQIGAPNFELAHPLRARIISGQEGTIFFFILEGTGQFTEVTEGFKEFESVDSCGNPVVLVHTTTDGRGGVKFKKGAGVNHALIGIRGAPIGPPVDVFAVGIPEVRIVQASNPEKQLLGIVREDPIVPDPEIRYLVEARLPVGFDQPVTASMKSYDPCGNEVPGTAGAMPSSISNVSMSVVTIDPSNRFAVFRTAQSFTNVDMLLLPGNPVPTLSGVLMVQTHHGWGVASIDATTFQEDSGRKQDLRIDKELGTFGMVAPSSGGNIDTGLVTLQVRNIAADSYQWTFQGPIGSVADHTSPAPNAKTSVVRLKIDDSPVAQEDMSGSGLGGAELTFGYDGLLNADARRPVFLVTLELSTSEGVVQTVKTVFFFRNRKSMSLFGAVAPPANSAALTAMYPLYKNLGSDFALLSDKFFFPPFFEEKARDFFDFITGMPAASPEVIQHNRRITWSAGLAVVLDPGVRAGTVSGTQIVIGNLGETLETSTFIIHNRPIGTALASTMMGTLDNIDVNFVIEHEQAHVNTSLGLSPIQDLLIAVRTDVLKQFFDESVLPGSKQTNENFIRFVLAARMFNNPVEEFDLSSRDLIRWAQNSAGLSQVPSNDDLQDGEFFVVGYAGIVKDLAGGLKITLQDGSKVTLKLTISRASLIDYVNTRLRNLQYVALVQPPIGTPGILGGGLLRQIYHDNLSNKVLKVKKPLSQIDAIDLGFLREWRFLSDEE